MKRVHYEVALILVTVFEFTAAENPAKDLDDESPEPSRENHRNSEIQDQRT